jgi:hypothetical protein
MERMGAVYRRPLRKILPAVVSTIAFQLLSILNHHDYGRAGQRGRP